MRQSVSLLVVVGIVLLALGALTFADEAATPKTEAAAPKLNPAVRQQAEDAIRRGAEWLINTQNPDGSWGPMPHPAIAALCGMGLHGAPGVDPAKSAAAVDKAHKFILGFVQPDGSISPAATPREGGRGGGGANYPNYNTAVVMLFLVTVNRADDRGVLLKARRFLQSLQIQDKTRADFGGISYGQGGHADLSNVAWAADALRATDYLDQEPFTEDPEAAKKSTAMWSAMQEFVTKCQNLQETNKTPGFGDDGGFVYRLDQRSGTGTPPVPADQAKPLLSYGSMSYAGLMSMLHARLTREDVRVKGALRYLLANYSLTENPGQGKAGHYYYLFVMTKALNAYGFDTLTDAKGVAHNWRQEVVAQFAGMQDPEKGYWKNADGRWMESLPELATSYALTGLQIAIGVAKIKYE